MNGQPGAFDLSKCARRNILALQPYRCARDDYKDDGTNILLDANENAYGPGLALRQEKGSVNGVVTHHIPGGDDLEVDLLGLNRYPDPHQAELKSLLCLRRNTHAHTEKVLSPENLFVGVGSDEAIDALFRCFCVPGHDKILTCPPTYGMYAVSAQVNDVEVVKVPLDPADFSLRPDAICDRLAADPAIKLVYLCSPGNPTANLLSKPAIQAVLEHPTWNGIVVLDEAYIDFAAARSASLAEWVLAWPNLVVLQTLSKAFGLAGIRLGAAFAARPVAALLNNLKAPYNVSNPTSQIARAALAPQNLAVMQANVDRILEQRRRLVEALPRIPGIGRFRGGFDANFVLVEILSRPDGAGAAEPDNEVALRVYEALAEQRGVVVRFRGNEAGCLGCLRITVGTEAEVDRFLNEIRSVLRDIYRSRSAVKYTHSAAETKEANDVIA